MFNDGILEPVKYYESELKNKFHESAESFFDKLVEKSGINAEKNRATASLYRSQAEKAKGAQKRTDLLKGVRVLLIVTAIAAIIAAFAAFIYGDKSYSVPLGATLSAAAATALVVIFAVLNKKIRTAADLARELGDEADETLKKARKQMAALNALFNKEMSKDLIKKAVPLIVIDDNFDVRRFDYMNGKYGFGDDTDPDSSTLDLMSGEIKGNPYLIQKRLRMKMGWETYYGSRVITYTERYTDSDGKTRTRTVTETLHASIQKPKPFYSETTRLVYGNDAAPDLVFSRQPRHFETLNDKQFEKRVKKGAKALEKKALKDATDDDPDTNFTKMGNDEFEVAFNAVDRNNEVQFRLLFTALAQKNMLSLVRNKSGYGDDFYFTKSKCLNYVSCEHFQSVDLDTPPDRYYSYDVDIARANFVDGNAEYFKSLYFLFAPVLSVPLYQQQKPKEYIYKQSFYRNMTSYEAEHLANRIGKSVFAHPSTASNVILKTDLMTKVGKSDRLLVCARSFRTERRCEHVSVFGGDGRYHTVPVDWLEYLPIERSSIMDMKELGVSDKEFSEDARAKKATERRPWAYFHGIFARAEEDGAEAELDKEFE